MSHVDLLPATYGGPIAGYTLLRIIADPLRFCTIHSDGAGNLVVGFSGTRDNWLDWLLNLDPWLEACSLIPAIQSYILDDPLNKITFVGHSQGGCHAVQLSSYFSQFAKDIEVVTIGALPTNKSYSVAPNVTITQYVHRRDPMNFVPWGLFRLKWLGSVVHVGPEGWPTPVAHFPSEYAKALQ